MIVKNDRIDLCRPDDFHVHFRLAEMLRQVAGYTARVFRRALVMPNTNPDILTGADARRYVEEIRAATTPWQFTPLMTIRLTPATTAETLRGAVEAGVVAVKLYAGITTNSAHGISDVRVFASVFAEMERLGLVLCLHGEVPDVFCLDRETAFLQELRWIAVMFPKLRIVLEHVTTAAAVRVVKELPDTVAATITAHHLRLTLRPHNFCMPVAKRPEDRAALIAVATSGNPKFFFGSDSAPHDRDKKESAEGCAGCFTAPVALELLAETFEWEGQIERLEAFVSEAGASFYGLPLNEGTITLARGPWHVPYRLLNSRNAQLIPFWAGEEIAWKVAA